jgi:hypothetical protein
VVAVVGEATLLARMDRLVVTVAPASFPASRVQQPDTAVAAAEEVETPTLVLAMAAKAEVGKVAILLRVRKLGLE